ncbi:MAG: PilZ domain-containing protein [Deltaproteobacteria bacterium]|nr:MAG: PilZ domain-containing protein [Deltaproteobacteria bacterium]
MCMPYRGRRTFGRGVPAVGTGRRPAKLHVQRSRVVRPVPGVPAPPTLPPSFLPPRSGRTFESRRSRMELFNAPLRYRFDHLDQARAHVVRAGDHSLFFFRHPRLSLAPGSSVQMEWTFQNAEPARMLHGTALETVDRCGVWMELHDTRPLRELRTLHNVRRHRRMATDRPVQIAWSGRVESGRLLDVSAGGARISGATGVVRGDLVELRLPSDEPGPLGGRRVGERARVPTPLLVLRRGRPHRGPAPRRFSPGR